MEDPSVIVGMACRVAGANNPRKLWDNIIAKKDVQRKFPAERLNIDAFYHPEHAHKGTTNQKHGYFLDEPVDLFDAEFFGISGKEAESIDPQQRLLLEVVYEALEDAGITLDEISGTNTSVFCGSLAFDYAVNVSRDLEYYPRHSITGQGNALLSNRVSYFYNLHGPSVSVDTACSSSLVTFHMGSTSILNGESDISIVLGASLLTNPGFSVMASDMGFFSSDGRCHSFDAAGSGYVRGDGICAVILKRKSLAMQQGNDIRAIVRATQVNHDGRKTGITVPSSKAQEAMIRSTYEKAGLDPDDTQFFEAHGTGTKIGDPAEARAIAAVFATPTRSTPLLLGSVKSNIGHLEGAAGLAGLIKATMALEKAKVPPNMNFCTPNPEIKFSAWKLQVPTSETDWPSSRTGIRRASCNSFGYGGANAHAVLEAYDDSTAATTQTKPRVPEPAELRPYLIPITAHTVDSGNLAVAALAKYLEAAGRELKIKDIAHSLSCKRSFHRARSFAVATSPNALINRLRRVRVTNSWNMADRRAPRLGFVFTGQGAQAFDMGRQLIMQSPLFRDKLQRCDKILSNLPDGPEWSLIDEFLRPKVDSRVAEAAFSQPMCTMLQLALVDLLSAWGIHPTAVCGHSSGEVAASYAAGILPFEAAVVVSYYRGLHMGQPRGKPGAMMAVGLGEKDAAAELTAFNSRVVIAAVNSPTSVTVSGDEDTISELGGILSERGVFVRRLEVKQAFHSHHMVPLAPAYKAALENCKHFSVARSTCRMFSSVTSRVVTSDTTGASYWAENMVRPVRFADALTGILLDENENQLVDVLVEIGPHPALKSPAREVASDLKLSLPYVATLTRGHAAYESMLATAGQLFAQGYAVDLSAVNQDQQLRGGGVQHVSNAKRLNDLPSYSWIHKSYWAETRLTKQFMFKERHSLLGAVLPGSTETVVTWRNYIRLNELPWLRGHEMDGSVVFPATGYVCLAVEGAVRMRRSTASISRIRLREVDIKSAMTLLDSELGTEVYLTLHPLRTSGKTISDEWLEFTVSSYGEMGQFSEHCRGLIAVEEGEAKPLEPLQNRPGPQEVLTRSTARLPVSTFYSYLRDIGVRYNDDFKLAKGHIAYGIDAPGRGFSVGGLHFEPGRYTADGLQERTILHPALLDSAIHLNWLAAGNVLGDVANCVHVPRSLKSLEISGLLVDMSHSGQPQDFMVTSAGQRTNEREVVNENTMWSADGTQRLIEGREWVIQGLGFRQEDHGKNDLFFQQRWMPCFDLLSPETMLPAQAPDVYALVDLFVFQHPSARILFVTSSQADVRRLQQSLRPEHLGGRQLYKLLHIFIPGVDEEQRQNIEEKLDVAICSPEGEYDLIVSTAEDFPSELLPKDRLRANTTCITTRKPIGVDTFGPVRIGQVYLYHRPRLAEARDLTVVVGISKMSGITQSILHELESLLGTRNTIKTMDMSSVLKGEKTDTDMVVLASMGGDIENAADWARTRHLLGLEDKNIVWVVEGAAMESSNPIHAKMSGLLRTARNENPQSRIVTLDIECEASAARVARLILQALVPTLDEDEIADRGGCVFIARLEEDVSRNGKLPNTRSNVASLRRLAGQPPLQLNIGTVGLLETLWFEPQRAIIDQPLGDSEIEIQVKASALNFRDVAIAMGLIQDWGLGNECAGVVTAIGSAVDCSHFNPGDRVLVSVKGAHATFMRAEQRNCRRIPDTMSFASASSFSAVLTTALYALFDVGRLRAGETILIHAGAGGVGQVAIQLAQRAGAKVLATCSEGKRAFLMKQFGLLDEQIFSSRDDSFVRGVMSATGGRGVDVVLNSLSGRLLLASWECIGWFGRFVEIGKRDIHQNTNLSMEQFRRNTTFAAVDMVAVFERTPDHRDRLMDDACKLVFDGDIRVPESLLEVPFAEVERAFRLLQLGKHIGKIILVPHDDDVVPVAPPSHTTEVAKVLFDASKTYLLVGGLGGLGLAVAEWMYLRGARNFTFLSRSGAEAPNSDTLEWLRARKATCITYNGDVTRVTDVERVLDGIGGSLGGIIHAAMVLQDSSIRTMSFSQWETCLSAKCDGAWNLHTAIGNRKLDFFICFSSIAAIVGNPGQGNYNAANAYLDSLMRWRRRQGLVGTSINIAAVSEVGVFAEMENMGRSQLEAITPAQLMYLIQEAVESERAFPESPRAFIGDTKQLITGLSANKADGPFRSRSGFRTFYVNRKGGEGSGGRGKNLQRRLATTTHPEARASILQQGFIEKVSAVMDVPVDSIRPDSALTSYGLDSIVAVELRRWFKEMAGVDVLLFDVLSAQPIASLITKVVSMMHSAVVASTTAAASNTMTNGNHRATVNSDTASLPEGPIQRSANSNPVAISAFQAPIFIYHRQFEEKWRLNVSIVITLRIQSIAGNMTAAAVLHASLVHLARRHSILSTAFIDHGSFVEQKASDAKLALRDYDFSKEASPHSALRELIYQQRRQTLKIEEGPPFQAAGVRISNDNYAMLMLCHRLVIDERSIQLLVANWTDILKALAAGKDPEDVVPTPRITYADFTLWHAAQLSSETASAHRKFWAAYLREAPAVSRLLPFARVPERPTTSAADTARHWTRLPANLGRRMKRLCSICDATPFTFVLAAFRAFIHCQTLEADLVLCLLNAKRQHADAQELVGCFTNAVPVRLPVADGNAAFIDQVATSAAEVTEVMRHSSVSYSEIVGIARAEARPGVSPLAQVAIHHRMAEAQQPVVREADNVKVLDVEIHDDLVGWEFVLDVLETHDEEWRLGLEHSLTLYRPADMEGFLDGFLRFLVSVIKDHRQVISEVDVYRGPALKEQAYQKESPTNCWPAKVANFPVCRTLTRS